MLDFRKDFPIYWNNELHDFHYLDSAATSLKPYPVIQEVRRFYERYTAPVHRSNYYNAERATEMYEESRDRVRMFINAKSHHEIVFTKNTNEGINIITNSLKDHLEREDVIVLSKMEHHANIVPWQKLCMETGARIYWLDFDKDYKIAYKYLSPSLIGKIKVISLTHASNVLGTINPVKEIFKYFKKHTKGNILTIVDGAQAIPHFRVDVRDLDCDYYVFSGHKMLAPSGIGVLYIKQETPHMTKPLLYGSHMINFVTESQFQINDDESSFEAGTPNIEGVIGLGEAIAYLTVVMPSFSSHEDYLIKYTLEKLSDIKGLTLYGSKKADNRLGIFSFNIDGVHAHDTAEVLGRLNISVRAGHHCAMPLMDRLGIPATVRASLYLYNSKDDIDALVKGIKEVKRIFKL